MKKPDSPEQLVPLSEVEARFEQWVRDTFHNVPGLSTELFNRFRQRADDFVACLRPKEP